MHTYILRHVYSSCVTAVHERAAPVISNLHETFSVITIISNRKVLSQVRGTSCVSCVCRYEEFTTMTDRWPADVDVVYVVR